MSAVSGHPQNEIRQKCSVPPYAQTWSFITYVILFCGDVNTRCLWSKRCQDAQQARAQDTGGAACVSSGPVAATWRVTCLACDPSPCPSSAPLKAAQSPGPPVATHLDWARLWVLGTHLAPVIKLSSAPQPPVPSICNVHPAESRVTQRHSSAGSPCQQPLLPPERRSRPELAHLPDVLFACGAFPRWPIPVPAQPETGVVCPPG